MALVKPFGLGHGQSNRQVIVHIVTLASRRHAKKYRCPYKRGCESERIALTRRMNTDPTQLAGKWGGIPCSLGGARCVGPVMRGR